MKKTFTLIIAAALLFLPGTVSAQSDIEKFPSCKYCGMDRQKFAHSRMLVEYADGMAVGTCSLHCLSVDFALNIDKVPKKIFVADYLSRGLIEADKAAWVIGGEKSGVMTRNAKWAFTRSEEARDFIIKNGGRLIGYDEAMKASFEDMYADTQMIRSKRLEKKVMHQH